MKKIIKIIAVLLGNDLESKLDKQYQAIVNRGAITNETDEFDFVNKLYEECQEVFDSSFLTKSQEYIDVFCVVYNRFKHLGIDIKKELNQNIKHQQTRKN